MAYYSYSRYSSTEESIKRAQYIKLRSKMQSILNKTYSLNNKVDNLKSSLKQCLTIDNDIYESNNYNAVDKNIDSLIVDINSVISSINSHI